MLEKKYNRYLKKIKVEKRLSLLSQIRGDAFAPRNPHALAIDYELEPPRFDISDTHFVYSWLEDKRAVLQLGNAVGV